MPEIGKRPEIRFAGFVDSWEQRKLKEIGLIITGNTPSTQIMENYSESGIPWVTPTDIAENVTISTAKKLSIIGQQVGRVVPKNTILVTCIASIGKNTMLGTIGSYNQQINGLIPNEKYYDPYFLLTESAIWSARMKKTAAAGTMQIVNRTEFSEIVTWLPKVEEQQQIGKFFRSLDDLITLHQRELEKLKNMKKALLEKMFPKNDSNIPEIRFAGFTDPWEQRKLSELGKILTGNTPPTSERENWAKDENGYVWITPTDINALKMSDSERHLTAVGWGKARSVPSNSVLITSIASIGKNTVNTVPAAFNQQINAIVPIENSAYFILAAMENEKTRFARLAGQTATAIINKTEFEKFSLFVPNLQEQERLSGFFENFDNLITLHQRRLEKFKNMKKALLNKMFV
ncbi:restriction endonuclease subunit S [Sphaerochaeta halotolerans]|uniref:restriction endonuclease subunit S n=1 Tax=Sphaerochaeta halotolerans TaxID=2293840 RepID=UPI00136F71E0|nr:restriction endonuclease subunit S [Sphaerochaeta halotolerans]MXI85966.1 restriction endonuclease subunit S [Sphaerochaeta halotolerans]